MPKNQWIEKYNNLKAESEAREIMLREELSKALLELASLKIKMELAASLLKKGEE